MSRAASAPSATPVPWRGDLDELVDELAGCASRGAVTVSGWPPTSAAGASREIYLTPLDARRLARMLRGRGYATLARAVLDACRAADCP